MEEERIRMENILSGNPLLNYSAQAPKSDLKVCRFLILHDEGANILLFKLDQEEMG